MKREKGIRTFLAVLMAVIITLCSCACAANTIITDDFNRTDGTDLGTTTDSAHYPWISGPMGTTASISSGRLLNNAGPNFCGVALGDILPTDIDATIYLQCTSGSWAGVAWRCPTAGRWVGETAGQYPGYGVIVTPSGTIYIFVAISSGLTQLDNKASFGGLNWATSAHKLRIRSVGSRHQVWADDMAVFDITNSAITTGGYFNTTSHGGSVSYYDDFRMDITPTLTSGSISGTITAIGTNAPISGATVSLFDRTTTTTADGGYSFTNLALGAYTVSAYDDTHVQSSARVTLTSGDPADVDLQLTPDTLTPITYIKDAFGRDDTAITGTLGTTEDVGLYPWGWGSGDTAATAGIAGNQMVLSGGLQNTGVSIAKIYPANLDISGTISMDLGGFTYAGISYRCSKPGYLDPTGYLAYVAMPNGGATGSVVNLFYGGVVTSTTVNIDFTQPHVMRVRAIGNRHQIYIDGTKYVDTTHSGTLTGGYAGFLRYSTVAKLDTVHAKVYTVAPPVAITGNVSHSDTGTPIPIENATITIDGYGTASTDASGNFTFGDLFPGVYTVTASKEGYIVQQKSVTATSGTPQPVAFSLWPELVITDTFNRSNNTSLGATEDNTHSPWLEWTNAEAEIADQAFHFNSTGTGYAGAVVGGICPKDVDLSVDLKSSGAGWSGIVYRCKQPGYWNGSNAASNTGYCLYIEPGVNSTYGTSGNIALYSASAAGPALVKILKGYQDIDWSLAAHNIRIRALGTHHQVWIDTQLAMDVYDNALTTGGYVGLINNGTTSDFDNLSVRILDGYGSITGTVTSSSTGSTISGAKVGWPGNYVFTLANGTYTLQNVPVDTTGTSSYSVTAWAQGYKAKTATAVAQLGQLTTANFQLDSQGTPEVVASVAAAKVKPVGTNVQFGNALVTGVFDGFFYVEDLNRAAGVKVVSIASVALGTTVTVTGSRETADNEKYISATEVTPSGTGEVRPIGFISKLFASSTGLSNIGLLSTVWGRVTHYTGNTMVINDGLCDDVTVICPTGTIMPEPDSLIGVVGVAGISSGKPVLYVRMQEDLTQK